MVLNVGQLPSLIGQINFGSIFKVKSILILVNWNQIQTKFKTRFSFGTKTKLELHFGMRIRIFENTFLFGEKV
jgi:hypothetical protein